MAHYYEQQASKVVVQTVLRLYGWKIYGYKEDMSDSMTDYFDPASWGGVAVKNGYILVVGINHGGKIGGSFVRNSYDNKVMQKLAKLEALRDCPSASVGEKANAQTMIDNIMGKANITEVVDTGLEEISYQGNPGNSKWHIEKNGDIIAKGTGVFVFGNLEYEIVPRYREHNTYYYTKEEEYNYKVGFIKGERGFYGTRWDDRYVYPQWKQNVLIERAKTAELLDKLFALIGKWNSLTTIKIGDGDEAEKLVKKTIDKKDTYYVAEISEVPTEYCKINDGWSIGDMSSYDVFKISEDGKSVRKLTREWTKFDDLGKSLHTFSLEPRKSTKPRYNPFTPDRFESKNGKRPAAVYIRLVEKTKTYTEEVWVKEKIESKPRRQAQAVSESEKAQQSDVNAEFEALIDSADIEDFTHTQTGEQLKVLKIKKQLGKEMFIEFNRYVMQKGIAYYSRFARGFVIKNMSLVNVA
ncbi:MAG: hypothetical protein PHE67_00605 [Campylobacterales bacterium]|nr:hypothetical protein [Campylobacterales bacterium]